MNYYDTLIAVADDCPVTVSAVPAAKGGKATVAVLQYEMLASDPYKFTQEDVLFESWLARQEASDDLTEADRSRLRRAFFAKPQACLRSSPLSKKYGWGLLFDVHGRIALCPMESPEYHRLAGGGDPSVTVRKALRSRRS